MSNTRSSVNGQQLPYDPNRLLPDDTNILVLDESGNLSRRSTDSFEIPSLIRRQQYSNNEIPDDDNKRGSVPISAVRADDSYFEITSLGNNPSTGILDAETVAKHVSKIGKTATGSSIACLTLTLPVS